MTKRWDAFANPGQTRVIAALWIIAAALLMAVPAHAAGDRVALVIGNSAYDHVSQLPNPSNDAQDMAAALERVGFEVDVALDLGYEDLRRKLLSFAATARGAEYALVFYAGHGIEVDNQNYLVPVDAELATDIAAQFEAVPLDMVLQSVSGATKLSMVLLDACRNNPFTASMERTSATRSIGRGLSPVEPGSGTLVGYAAEGGSVASDGDGRNSPYTEGLLTYLEKPGLEVNMLFRQVRDHVMRETANEQRPFVYGSLPGESLYLVPPGDTPTDSDTADTETTPSPPQSNPATAEARLAWEAIKDTDSKAIIQAYIDNYPDSIYAVFARARLVELNQTQREDTAEVTPEPEPEPEPPVTPTPAYTYPPIGSGDSFVLLGAFSLDQRAKAEERLSFVSGRGVPAYIIETSNYSGMTANLYAVVLGPYSRNIAESVLPEARRYISDAYVRNATRKTASTNPSANCAAYDGLWRVTGIRSDDTLNVRSGPSTSYAILGELPPDASGIHARGCVDGWCKVQWGCLSGFAYDKYLATAGVSRTYKVIDHRPDDMLNVRTGTSTDYAIVGRIPHNGTNIVVHRCVESSGYIYNWCEVSYDTVRGWAYARYLQDADGNHPH